MQLEQTRKIWPGGKGKTGFKDQSASRVAHYPTDLLSGAMVCKVCGRAMVKRSGKGGGYYGCINAGKGACDNKLIVRKTLTERVILAAVSEKLSNTENLTYLLQRVEEKVREMQSEVPETIRLKEVQLIAEQRRVENFVSYIAQGRSNDAVGRALDAAERKAKELADDLIALRASREKVLEAPPIEWIAERVDSIQEVLEQRAEKSALILRKLLGRIRLEPVQPDIGKPYLKATSGCSRGPRQSPGPCEISA